MLKFKRIIVLKEMGMGDMAANQTLQNAKQAQNDEFYTQISDVEKELRHYKEQFRGKVVFCNCDDPYESNFFKFFAMNFNFLGLKKLTATCYTESPIAGEQLSLFDIVSFEKKSNDKKHPYKIEITEVRDENGDGAVDLADVQYLLKNRKNTLKLLEGDGDFRSPECVKLLKEADIVITNPPFSLFREYVAQLIEYDKKFLIIGGQNAITYKETFQFIKENKIWLGVDNGGTKWFRVPEHYDIKTESRIKFENGIKYFSMGSIMWFTNLDHAKRHKNITLYKRYTVEEYPHYDNYDAIEVSKVAEIPFDWDGLMGVPITFLDKFNPEQFEILGITDRQNTSGLRTKKYTALISPKYNDLNARGVIKINGELKAMYARILIKRKGATQ